MFQNRKKFIIYLIGIIVLIPSAYAATILFDSAEVGYENINLNATTVQAALDEINDIIDDYYENANTNAEKRLIYRWSSATFTKDTTNISSMTENTDYVISQSSVNTMNTRANSYYLAHSIQNNVVKNSYVVFTVTPTMVSSSSAMSVGVYTVKGGEASAYTTNKDSIKDAFGQTNCTDNTTSYTCTAAGLTATITSLGEVTISTTSGNCNVTSAGASSCTAIIPAPASFATDSWETIINAVQNNNISVYSLGNEKTIDLGGLGVHTLRIANKGNNDPTDCTNNTNYSQTACGFVLEFKDIVTMETMNSVNSNSGGWPNMSLRTYLNSGAFWTSLPEILQNNIIQVRAISGHEKNATDNYVSYDKIYLVGETEIYGAQNEDSVTLTQTRQLDYYSSIGVTNSNCTGNNGIGPIKYDGTGTATDWWTRTARCTGSFLVNYGFWYVKPAGDKTSYVTTQSSGVSPAFRLG